MRAEQLHNYKPFRELTIGAGELLYSKAKLKNVKYVGKEVLLFLASSAYALTASGKNQNQLILTLLLAIQVYASLKVFHRRPPGLKMVFSAVFVLTAVQLGTVKKDTVGLDGTMEEQDL